MERTDHAVKLLVAVVDRIGFRQWVVHESKLYF